jgi:hypothetical protein
MNFWLFLTIFWVAYFGYLSIDAVASRKRKR